MSSSANIEGTKETVEGCQVTHRFLKRKDVEIHFVECGERSKPLVLLLHGFPSFWYTWKHQFGPLSEKGYHIVALDLRGYNLSSKLEAANQYSREELTLDVLAFVEKFSKTEPIILVGHDWGGYVSWAFAQDYPQKVKKLAVLNMPHPKMFSKTLVTNPYQMKKSWYIFLFQIPSLGETFISRNNHVTAFSIPGALTSAINYYKASVRGYWRKPQTSEDKVTLPVCIIWGENDIAFIPELADPPKDLVPNCTILKFPEASHWVMWDEPEKVNKKLLDFFQDEFHKVKARL